MTKYAPLGQLLAAAHEDVVELDFEWIDSIVGGLPASARRHQAWWSNSNSVQAASWLGAGFRARPDLVAGRVTFRRVGATSATEPSSAPARSLDMAEAGRPVVLVGCVKSKLDVPAMAKDLYVSPLFRGARAAAERRGGAWFILSAEHGLLEPHQLVAPYERRLSEQAASYRDAWGAWVVARLELLLGGVDGRTCEIHAGSSYVGPIRSRLEMLGATVSEPLEGFSIGQRLAHYAAAPDKHWEADSPSGPDPRGVAAHLGDPAVARHAAEIVVPDEPGLYSWWVDVQGARDLSRGLGIDIQPGLIYAGQAGATRWPSGTTSRNTLRKRIGSMHLRGRISGSTFRHTIASILQAEADEPMEEAPLSQWMSSHLSVSWWPTPDPDTLGSMEEAVLSLLDPPLNLDHMSITPVRSRLKALRRDNSRRPTHSAEVGDDT